MGAPRQDRTRSDYFRFLLLSLVTFSVVAGMYLLESRRTSAIVRAHQASESRELDERFGREAERITVRLTELKAEAVRAISFADRRRFPSGVVSVSVWENSASGPTKILGLPAEGIWEQALYRILPAEIAKRPGFTVLPLVGPELASDPSAETLRIGLFPEGDGIHVTVIAFRPSTLLAGLPETEMAKEYLIEESGLVLAHTRKSEVGERTSALADLYRNAEAKSAEREKAHRLVSKSWEGFPATIRFTRLPGWNAFFVMEKVHSPIKAATNPVFILIMISGTLLGILFLGIAVLRRENPAEEPVVAETVAPKVIPAPRQGLRELRANPPAFVRKPSAISPPVNDISSELGRFITAREARSETMETNRIHREKFLLEEFESDAKRARNIERLEEKLVESVSGATRSPVLFFRYDPRQGICRLSAEAGYPASQSIMGAGGMSFALETGLVSEIHAEVARGRQKNLWEYPPLGRVMLTRLGIANFEAWPMTETVNSNLGPSRLLGVLVVAESGVDSVLHRAFLGALLERASRHYTRQIG